MRSGSASHSLRMLLAGGTASLILAAGSARAQSCARTYPPGLHGYLFDTSEMMYLDKDNTWVRRDLVSSAVGDPIVDGKVQIGPQSPYNGIQGDARRSTVELGKRAVDMKVDYAVRQIRSFPPAE